MVLSRFFRNHDITPLFEKAKALLEPGWGVGVVQSGKLLVSLGLTDDHLDRPGAMRFSSSFSINGHPEGHVVVAPTQANGGPFLAGGVQQVADILAQSLEMLLRQEDARRALASDTLQKYRELALLHRATVGLNASLRLREVGRELLAECQSGALPTEMGMIFLRDQNAKAPLPLASFGLAKECQLDRITGSALFADIMRGGKGEVISDLGSDIRWNGEVSGVTALLIAPIVAADSWAGALVLATTKDVHIEAKHLQYVTTLASVADPHAHDSGHLRRHHHGTPLQTRPAQGESFARAPGRSGTGQAGRTAGAPHDGKYRRHRGRFNADGHGKGLRLHHQPQQPCLILARFQAISRLSPGTNVPSFAPQIFIVSITLDD
jgi:hypothetical protein